MVIIPAGVPRKPGMTRDDLFKVQPLLLCRAVLLLLLAALRQVQVCAWSQLTPYRTDSSMWAQINAGIVRDLIKACGEYCPKVCISVCIYLLNVWSK